MMRNSKARIGLAALLALPVPAVIVYADATPPAAADNNVFTYHQTEVLGTSLDLKLVAASQADADACEQTILKEVERLRLILSTYDANSEVSKFQANTSPNPIHVSSDLHDVLADYMRWRTASAGAYTAQLGDLIDLWTAAEKKGQPPTDGEIAPLVAKAHQNAMTLVSDTSVRKLLNQKLNIDSLGKGYIVQKAAALAKLKHPTVTGILLNIGGDITALGFSTPPSVKPGQVWKVAVADPDQPADNATPLMNLKLKDKAVATSGAYERFFTFGDKKLSHIINPLTGKPAANDVQSATVIASDNATANALATILCVMPPAEGIKLVEKTPGAVAMLVMTGGKQMASKGFAAFQDGEISVASAGDSAPTAPPAGGSSVFVPPPADGAKPAPAAAANPWPKNFVLSVDMTLLPSPQPKYVPYTTMWIEDGNGRSVKILASWIGDKKYLQVMKAFAKSCNNAPDFAATTRASRRSGEYTILWDGTDSANNAVSTGNYFLCIEVACEHGTHSTARQAITCGATASTTTVAAATFWNAIPVRYGASNAKSN